MNVLDLFSGIGSFSLGLERAGMRTVAFCEIDPFCRRVLAKHWPHIRCFEDIRELTAERLAATASTGDIAIDVICGGFPCQDISHAGNKEGISGERSGLWAEYRRLIGEVRPRYVIVENVAALLGRGLDVVLGDLATLGYDAEWHCIRASDIGAPHERDRLWIIAYPNAGELRTSWQAQAQGWAANLLKHGIGEASRMETWRGLVADMDSAVYGFAGLVDCLRPLGNTVIPQIPEIIGKAIMSAEMKAAVTAEECR